jgi:hypothetical protein
MRIAADQYNQTPLDFNSVLAQVYKSDNDDEVSENGDDKPNTFGSDAGT